MSASSREWLVCLAASGLLIGLPPATTHAQKPKAGPKAGTVEVEVVKERYPNRSIKIERHVTLDEKRNYVNHGMWTMFAQDGTTMARGVYWKGKRQGKWIRWIADEPVNQGLDLVALEGEEGAQSAAEIIGIEFDGFSQPFRSEADFVDGKLVGSWTIFDADDRTVAWFEFDQNQLHGTANWYYPSGQTRRQIGFEKDAIVDNLKEWEPDGSIARNEQYIGGRRKVEFSKQFDTGEKHSEGHYLYPTGSAKVSHDWWDDAVSIVITDAGDDKLKHGMWQHWYSNGGKQTEGEFDSGKAVGLHLWWYANGQMQTQGHFINGKQSGQWTWWHPNGIKKTDGQIIGDNKVGIWSEWDADGSLVTEHNHGGLPRVRNTAKMQPQPMKEQALPAAVSQPAPRVSRPLPQTSQQPPNVSQRPRQWRPVRFPLRRSNGSLR